MIEPPLPGFAIDRTPVSWWRTSPTALWFWELPKRDMGVWAPISCVYPVYEGGKFRWREKAPSWWVRVP